jgi:hypothetical protein
MIDLLQIHFGGCARVMMDGASFSQPLARQIPTLFLDRLAPEAMPPAYLPHQH